jgi:serine/threonine protein kinase
MDSALASRIAPSVPIVFQDALGERRRLDGNGPDPVEVLCLRSELTAIPSFEFALRERAGRLASFRHANYSRVRGVDRLNDPAATLAVVSDHTRGLRLAALLSESGPRPITIDITVALHFIRQLVSAVAMLHESARDIAHGAIGPERLIVTPNARIVVVEYVLGAALEQLRFSRERYWRELRIALPSAPGLPRFDHRADVTQIGVVALSLILGRILHEDEFIAHGADLVASAKAIAPKGGQEPLPAGLRNWLARALQLDTRHSFASAPEARAELEKAVAGDTSEPTMSVSMPNGDHASHAPAGEQKAPEQASVTRSSGVRPMPVTEPAPPPAAAVRLETEPEAIAGWSEPVPDFGIADVRDFTTPEPFERRKKKTITFSFASGANKTLIGASAAGLVILSLGGYAARRALVAPVAATAAATGTLNVTTNPAGAEVRVDGQAAGVTPLTLTLKAGPHNIELRGGGEPRTVPVTITAGTQATQYLELPRAAPASVGQLQVRTEPAGAPVSVDGVPRGRSPVLVDNLRPGDHAVVVDSEYGAVRHTVAVTAATTASLVVPLTPAEGAPVSGWLSVTAPVDVQIFENKRLVGTSQSDRIMVSAGRHEIEIVNEVLGYRSAKTVQVPAGRVVPIKVEWPRGTIAINAVPWAEVWIDGDRVGETPIGNHPLPIGPHEIVFRHPELGELRYAATVTMNAPARVSVDLRKKP